MPMNMSPLAHEHPQTAALDAQARKLDDNLVAHQHALAKPYPYRFEIRLAKDAKK